jgi:hypothetical protein
MNKPWKALVVVLAVLVVAVGTVIWYKLRHVDAQPTWMTNTPQNRYFYGSVGAGETRGIPYWVWLAIPRLFPEHMPGPGGYASVGMAWEEGTEMPVGFAKQKVGFIRVTGTCDLCHVMIRPTQPDQAPQILPAVAGKTTDIKPLLNFLQQCAADPRFNADEFFSEIDTDTSLSLWDKALYRYVLIPRPRKALLDDPGKILFSPAIQAHRQNPQSDAPFSDPETTILRDYVRQQSRPPAP